MAQYKLGLHKDVETIFKGVWDSQLDNIDQHFSSKDHSIDIPSKYLIPEHKIHDSRFKVTSNLLEKEWKAFLLMPPKKKRKRKRFLSISRYLLTLK